MPPWNLIQTPSLLLLDQLLLLLSSLGISRGHVGSGLVLSLLLWLPLVPWVLVLVIASEKGLWNKSGDFGTSLDDAISTYPYNHAVALGLTRWEFLMRYEISPESLKTVYVQLQTEGTVDISWLEKLGKESC